MNKYLILAVLFVALIYQPVTEGQPTQLSMTVLWSIPSSTHGFNPTTSGVVVADVVDNGNGVMEIFYAGQNYITCRKGTDGSLIWLTETTEEHAINWHIQMAIDDINNDGKLELVIAHYREIYCIDAETGVIKWIYTVDYSGWTVPTRVDKQFVIIDTNNNGYKHIFIGVEGYNSGQLSIAKLDWNGNYIDGKYVGGICWGGLAAADLDGDGTVEIIANHAPGAGIVCFDTNLNIKWQVTGIQASSHPPTIADVNNDGILDVISIFQKSHDNRGIWVIDGATGQKMTGKYQDSISGFNGWNDMAVYDINNDGYVEVIASYQNEESDSSPNPATVFSLKNWQIEATLPYPIRQSPNIANVGPDSGMEIICATVGGTAVYKYYNDEYIKVFERNGGLWGCYGDVRVLDVTGDGYNEMLMTFGNGYNVVCIKTQGKALDPQPLASATLSNYRRTKVSEYVPNPGEEGTAPPPPPDEITVLTPNGFEKWEVGTKRTITWSQNFVGFVDIELYKENIKVQTLAQALGTSFEWNIPATLEPRTDYKIRITKNDEPSVYDISDDPFSIIPHPEGVRCWRCNEGIVEYNDYGHGTVCSQNTDGYIFDEEPYCKLPVSDIPGFGVLFLLLAFSLFIGLRKVKKI